MNNINKAEIEENISKKPQTIMCLHLQHPGWFILSLAEGLQAVAVGYLWEILKLFMENLGK